MQKLLPILLATTLYLTPLYPVYAQGNLPGPALGRLPAKDKMLNESTTGAKTTPPGLGVAILRVKNATAEAKLQKAIDRFKNKNKGAALARINVNLNDINYRHTTQMQNALDKISEILERLKNKAASLTSSEADSAISKAQLQWSEALAAVEAQSAKDYTINLNTEATAASDAGATRNSLRMDLKATHTQVVEARQALANAIKTVVSTLKGGNNGSE